MSSATLLRDGNDSFAYATRNAGGGPQIRREHAKKPKPVHTMEQAAPWKWSHAASRSSLLTADNGIASADYHFGACTLHVKCLPEELAHVTTCSDMFRERLEGVGKVLQATVRIKERKTGEPGGGPRSWALVTLSSAKAVQKVISRNAAHVDGLVLEMVPVDVVKAYHSSGVFKVIYEEAKKKAAAAQKREEMLARRAEKEKVKVSAEEGRNELAQNVKLAHIGVSGEYNYGCAYTQNLISNVLETATETHFCFVLLLY